MEDMKGVKSDKVPGEGEGSDEEEGGVSIVNACCM